MILYGLLFLLLVGAAVYTLAGFARWLSNPDRHFDRRLIRALAPACGAWVMSFFVPFAAEWLGSIDALIGAIWLVTLISAAILAAGAVKGVWGPISGGSVLAGSVWGAAIGIYLMHATGWQGLSLDDLGSDRAGVARVWIGALFFSPGAFALGFLLGGLWNYVAWRGRTRGSVNPGVR